MLRFLLTQIFLQELTGQPFLLQIQVKQYALNQITEHFMV